MPRGDDAVSGGNLYEAVQVGYDETQQSLKTIDQAPPWDHYVDPIPMVTDALIGIIDDTYVDIGLESMKTFTHLFAWVVMTQNSSTGNELQLLGKLTAGGSEEFPIETAAEYQKDLGDGNMLMVYVYKTYNGIPFVLLQSKAADLGVTPAFLTGDTDAQSTPGTWAAVTDGSFRITIDGTAYNIDGIDFTGDSSMAEVAATIQAALRAATGALETVVWSADHFVITTIDSANSAITVTETSTGIVGTDISGAGAADWMDADSGNGVVTDMAGSVAILSVEITKSFLASA